MEAKHHQVLKCINRLFYVTERFSCNWLQKKQFSWCIYPVGLQTKRVMVVGAQSVARSVLGFVVVGQAAASVLLTPSDSQ